jgi:UDP-GlcNAc:undecaprenyl-phosphate GlcNAc-1-phosphate transferase
MATPAFPGGRLFLLAFPLSLALTWLIITLAHRYGWLAKPKADRWHQKPTALFGGVAIFLTFAAGFVALLSRSELGRRYDLLGLILGGALVFTVGLRDDIKALNPLVKLLGQVMATTPFLVGSLLAHPTPAFTLSIPLLLFWMVALTNAFNLLDNMDGLSAGTAAIVGGLLAVYAALHGLPLIGVLSALLSASCLGFLWFNFRVRGSARVFIGDCGILFLGYMLAGLTVLGVCPTASDRIAALCTPLLLMALPLFDTTLVIIIRKREHRAISQGGRDHSSHRLVYSGYTEKQAVLLSYSISLLGGGAGLLLESIHQPVLTVSVTLATALGLASLGIYLNRYSTQRQAVVPAPVREVTLDAPKPTSAQQERVF